MGALRVRGLVGVGVGPIDLDLAARGYGCLLGGAEDGGGAVLQAVATVQANAVLVGSGRPWLAFGRVIDRIRGACAADVPRAVAGRRAAALAEEFGLDPSRRVASLAAEGWRRLRLACALAGRPGWLLLDGSLGEEAEGLGRVLREACRHAEVGVLHATARRDEAFAVADTVFLLGRGRVLQSGTPAVLYERPDSLAIALRVGPGSALRGTIVAVAEERATVQLRDGPSVAAAVPEGVADCVGRACTVLLRPERIAISALAATELGGGAVAGVLRGSAHLGDTIRLTVAIGTDTEVVVSRPSALGGRGLVVGRQVSLAWQAHHALTFLDVAA